MLGFELVQQHVTRHWRSIKEDRNLDLKNSKSAEDQR